MNSNKCLDVMVIGLGAMGSATVYQLSKRGVSVLGIDQFKTPHTNGSSHGDTRITRQAIGEGEHYVPLVLRSHEIWKELEKITGEEIFTVTGGLIVEPQDGKISHGAYHFLQNTINTAKRHGISHEVLSFDELSKRFPQFVFQGDESGYFEAGAGFVRPEKSIEIQLDQAEKLGAALHFEEKMIGFTPQSDGTVVVQTDKKEYRTNKLILSVGPWIADYIPSLKHIFKVHRQVLYWFDIKHDFDQFEVAKFPVFMVQHHDGNEMYGFPAVDGRHGGIKVACEELGTTTSPADIEREVSEKETQEIYEKYLQDFIPSLSGKCLRSATCMYTMTPDSQFVIDTLPEYKQVIVASPCSGHGFKHSAAIGQILCELALNEKSSFDISHFSLKRFD